MCSTNTGEIVRNISQDTRTWWKERGCLVDVLPFKTPGLLKWEAIIEFTNKRTFCFGCRTKTVGIDFLTYNKEMVYAKLFRQVHLG